MSTTMLRYLDYEGTYDEIKNILVHNTIFPQDTVVLSVSMVGGYEDEWNVKGPSRETTLARVSEILQNVIDPCPLDTYVFDLFIEEDPDEECELTTSYKFNVFGYLNASL